MSNYKQKDLFQTQKKSTSSLAPTLVSRFPLQARKGAKKMKDTSGLRLLDLLKTTEYVHVTLLEKMLVDTLDSVSTQYQRTWSVVVTDGGALVLKQRVSGQIIDDKESGGSQKTRTMIPTATASDHIERKSTSSEAMNPMTGKSVTLDRFVKFWPTKEIQKSGKPQMWPTPTTKGYGHGSEGQYQNLYKKMMEGEITKEELEIMTATKLENHRSYEKMQKMWPTPTANEDAAGRPEGKMQRMLGNHPDVRSQGIGTLNPTWVEWLMGFPTGWTDLKD
tara:strand:+ start:431 stop:1261 length:831 start_codon:yes stop_codon:yes gene_type:complete